jgi:hypothetical protein
MIGKLSVGDVVEIDGLAYILADNQQLLACRGGLADRRRFPKLYEKIQHTYSDEDKRCCTSSHFVLPNLDEDSQKEYESDIGRDGGWHD